MYVPAEMVSYLMSQGFHVFVILKQWCGRSADEFSTSSTSSAHPQDLYSLLLTGGREMCTQSVRPFVQSSSCEARCREEGVTVGIVVCTCGAR